MTIKTFDPERQYRCPIIRGKAQSALDDLLPAYAEIIAEICPCQKSVFDSLFNEKLAKYLGSPTDKTLANHRTENAGKLFGMWWKDKDDIIHASKRSLRLLERHDNPEFFKDVVSKFQFPNGMDKVQTTIDRINHKINIRPVAFLLKVMVIAESEKIFISKDEAAYY